MEALTVVKDAHMRRNAEILLCEALLFLFLIWNNLFELVRIHPHRKQPFRFWHNDWTCEITKDKIPLYDFILYHCHSKCWCHLVLVLEVIGRDLYHCCVCYSLWNVNVYFLQLGLVVPRPLVASVCHCMCFYLSRHPAGRVGYDCP